MERDTIIIHGTGMHIMHDRGLGDSMFTTIHGRVGRSVQVGGSRMDGLHINQELSMQDGGVRQNTIRCTEQPQDQFIVKGTIQCIAKQ